MSASDGTSHERLDPFLGVLHAQLAGDELWEERVAQGSERATFVYVTYNSPDHWLNIICERGCDGFDGESTAFIHRRCAWWLKAGQPSSPPVTKGPRAEEAVARKGVVQP